MPVRGSGQHEGVVIWICVWSWAHLYNSRDSASTSKVTGDTRTIWTTSQLKWPRSVCGRLIAPSDQYPGLNDYSDRCWDFQLSELTFMFLSCYLTHAHAAASNRSSVQSSAISVAADAFNQPRNTPMIQTSQQTLPFFTPHFKTQKDFFSFVWAKILLDTSWKFILLHLVSLYFRS